MAQVLPKVVPQYTKPWQILVSVCLTRMNRITAELSDLEKRYAEMQREVEFEESVYNNREHDKIHLKKVYAELENAAQEEGGLSDEREADLQDASRRLADMEDNEEAWGIDLAAIVTAPRETQYDDDSVDRNSLDRKLDKILHCVIKDAALLSGSSSSLYPYTAIEEGESLRYAADRLLSTYNLDENVIYFSNAPAGVLKLNFEAGEERGELYRGAKLFFLKAHLHIPVETNVEDVEWLTLEELRECCNEGYFKRVKDIVS